MQAFSYVQRTWWLIKIRFPVHLSAFKSNAHTDTFNGAKQYTSNCMQNGKKYLENIERDRQKNEHKHFNIISFKTHSFLIQPLYIGREHDNQKWTKRKLDSQFTLKANKYPKQVRIKSEQNKWSYVSYYSILKANQQIYQSR